MKDSEGDSIAAIVTSHRLETRLGAPPSAGSGFSF
jgi:hypothetical protein